MQDSFSQKLSARNQQNLLRRLTPPAGHDFCSNDYLGFAQDLVLQKRIQENLAGITSGSAGSRLLRGNLPLFTELENKLAAFSEREAAIFFPSGYQANIGLLSAILDAETMVFSDEFNHASLIDGIRLSSAQKQIFKHNSMEDLEKKLQLHPLGKKVIVVESVYSMTGDKAPLQDLVDLAEEHGTQIIVDEAHATGMYGAGLIQKMDLQRYVLATVHSGAKALGVAGSWVACDSSLKDYLVNFSRPFIYSTAPSPLVTAALLTSLNYWQDVGRDRAELCLDKAKNFSEVLSEMIKGAEFTLSGESQILFLTLHSSAKALAWSEELQAEGFDIRAIRYPTVPEDQAGLRISLQATHSDALLDQLLLIFKNLVLAC